MTADQLRGWLQSRQPAPPAALAARLELLLAASPPGRLSNCLSLTDALSSLALSTLHGLDGRGAQGENVALDLLAADAFVTYAFEAAAEEGRDAAQVAEAVLARLEA